MHPRKLSRAIALTLMLSASSMALGQVTVTVNLAPPALPVYDQPPIPADGYVWTPGYWAWGDEDQGYYWVPGTWVEAPEPGLLWTPGYWAFSNGAYLWNGGYWGPHVGFYGGVNYGFGYTGSGYQGGYWRDNHLYYNRSVVNVGSTHITNVYNKTVINNVTVNRISYNGGDGGLRARPSAAEEQAGRDRHMQVTAAQREHVDAARKDTALRAAENHGKPSIAATAQPGRFSGNVVAARTAGAVSQPQHNVPAQNHNEPRAGGEPRVPENRNAPAIRRDLEREEAQSPRQVNPQVRASPRAQPAPEPRSANPPRAIESRPVQEARPAQPQRSVEAPREAPRPVAAPPRVEQHQQEMHTPAPAPRPNVPEPRPQPHPQERAPDHH